MDGLNYANRVCQGLCRILDPQMGLCCGLCSTDSQHVQKVYLNVKRQHEQGKRPNFKVIPTLEINVDQQPVQKPA